MRFVLSLMLFVCAFAVSFNVHAKGQLMVQPTLDERTQRVLPMIGLGIYENLWGKSIAFNSWTGAGSIPEYEMTQKIQEKDVWWMTTRNQIDFHLPRFTISPGFQLLKTTDEAQWNRRVYIRLSAQLW